MGLFIYNCEPYILRTSDWVDRNVSSCLTSPATTNYYRGSTTYYWFVRGISIGSWTRQEGELVHPSFGPTRERALKLILEAGVDPLEAPLWLIFDHLAPSGPPAVEWATSGLTFTDALVAVEAGILPVQWSLLPVRSRGCVPTWVGCGGAGRTPPTRDQESFGFTSVV